MLRDLVALPILNVPDFVSDDERQLAFVCPEKAHDPDRDGDLLQIGLGISVDFLAVVHRDVKFWNLKTVVFETFDNVAYDRGGLANVSNGRWFAPLREFVDLGDNLVWPIQPDS